MNSNKKKIAFLVSRELTKRDINRFYLNEIVKKYDVNIQFYIIKNINEFIKKKYNSEFQSKVIRGESDLKVNLIKYNADELILVFPFTKKTLWVHKTISYLNINYSYLALANNPLSNRSILYNLFFKIKSIGFKSANKIYFSGSSNINLLSMYLIGLRTKVIKTGSYDYNLYLIQFEFAVSHQQKHLLRQNTQKRQAVDLNINLQYHQKSISIFQLNSKNRI